MARRGIVLLAAVLLWPAAAGARQRDPDPLDSDLKEEVEVRLVQLTIFATDPAGLPVTDLELDEIVIKDKGKRIQAAFLDPKEAREPPAIPVRLFVNVPGGPKRPVRTNGGGRDHYILFIDTDNEPPLRRANRMESERLFSEGGFGPADQVAVLSFNGESNLETPFTTDRAEIVEGITAAYDRTRRPRLDRERELKNLITRLRACDDRRCVSSATSSYAFESARHGQDFLRALEATIRYAGGLEGRKAILAVSHGAAIDLGHEIADAVNYAQGIGSAPAVPMSFSDEGSANQTRMDSITALAIRLGVTLHFITQPPKGGGPFLAGGGDAPHPTARPLETAQAQARREMSHIASATGGRLVVNEDLNGGLEQSLELERAGYVLGYYLEKPPKPNQLRRVKVESNRRGVDIVAPRAYYQYRQAKKTVEGELSVGDSPSVLSDGRRRIPFTVTANPNELGYSVSKEGAIANLTLETTLLFADGQPLARTYHFVNHAYDRKEWKAKEVEPLQISGWIEVPAGSYDLSVVIRNPKTERQGTYSRTVSVPAP